jgi:hypothetical protein
MAVMNAQQAQQVLAALNAAQSGIDEARMLVLAHLPVATDVLGEIAHRHLEIFETTGELTVEDSRKLRHEIIGVDIRSTANLFGKKGEGALFYRDVPTGTRTLPSQPIRLTNAGLARAHAYRKHHGLPSAA